MILNPIQVLRDKVLKLSRADFASHAKVSVEEVASWEAAGDPVAAAEIGVSVPQILKLAHMGEELAAVAALMNRLREAERSTRQMDPENAGGSWQAAAAIRAEMDKKLGFLQELRMRAYGKVVIVRRIDTGELRAYRITQANYGFPDLEYPSGLDGKQTLKLINRQSAVASRLVTAALGEMVELRVKSPSGWVEQELAVVGIVHLERHFGNELLGHYDDFKGFSLSHADLSEQASATEVAWSFKIGVEDVLALLAGGEAAAPLSEEPRREVQRTDQERLGAHFYTRTTKLQESLLNRPSQGLLLVTGVAGSGKTSVALGRAKVLCDRTRDEGEEEPDFFRPETAVGFVLSAQLSTYLQQACAQLQLGAMPVHEFRQLREDLITKRSLEDGDYQRARRSSVDPGVTLDGTMSWLRAADVAVAKVLASRLRDAVSQPPAEQEAVGARRRTTKPRNADQVAALGRRWQALRTDIDRLAALLERGGEPRRLRLHRLVAQIDSIRAKFARDLEGDEYWTGNVNNELRQNVRSALRERIVRAFKLTDCYAEAVAEDSFRDDIQRDTKASAEESAQAVQLAQTRLASKQLADEDIDVVLALNHLVSVGYQGRDGRDPISHLEETSYYSQVFIDEFQDFSEVQIFLMGAQADPRRHAVTMVGDLRQRLQRGRAPRFQECFPWATGEELEVAFLLENKRQTPVLSRLSHAFRQIVLLEEIEAGDFGPERNEPAARVIEVPLDGIADAVFDEVRRLHRSESVAVLCSTEGEAAKLEATLRDDLLAEFRETRLSRQTDLIRRYFVHFTTPREAKGLEFDAVVVADLGRFDLNDPTDANAAYVAVSRPRRSLSLVAVEDELDPRVRELLDRGLLVRPVSEPRRASIL